MYADLNPGAHLLSNQMPCLLKAYGSLSVVLATRLQMDKRRLIEEKKKIAEYSVVRVITGRVIISWNIYFEGPWAS